MVLFLNQTGTIGTIITAVNTNITGSMFLTLLLIVALFCLLFMAFRLPLEVTIPFILPMLLVFMAFEGALYAAGGVLLLYVGVIIAKNWVTNTT